MKIAYFDCFSGISGDMCLGALVDAGLPFDVLQNEFKGLPVSAYTIESKKVLKQGISATKVNIFSEESQPSRNIEDIYAIINDSSLPSEVKKTSTKIFRQLAQAEARVHGMPPESVHLHEAGAVDAILDITGTAFGLFYLGIERVYSSPLPPGGGSIKSRHGLIPVPGPAVLQLLKDIPLAESPAMTELVTPTGAAIAVSLARDFGPIPPMNFHAAGYGAGTKELEHANIMRLIIGSADASDYSDNIETDSVGIIETNIDDLNPEFYSHLEKQLLSLGALDYTITPIQMKKGRPGVKLTVLVPEKILSEAAGIIFRETSTLGCRIRTEKRLLIKRAFIRVDTPYGKIDVKYNLEFGTVSPETSQCEEISVNTGASLKTVYEAAKASAMRNLDLI